LSLFFEKIKRLSVDKIALRKYCINVAPYTIEHLTKGENHEKVCEGAFGKRKEVLANLSIHSFVRHHPGHMREAHSTGAYLTRPFVARSNIACCRHRTNPCSSPNLATNRSLRAHLVGETEPHDLASSGFFIAI